MSRTIVAAAAMASALSAPAGADAQAAEPWRDPSPHQVRFVTVAPDVKLEVLDWGGTGRDVVLLTGSGHTAHVYDEFALKLKDCCHVYGVTRRGYGASSIPPAGYDEPSLSNDVWMVIQALDLKAPVLIGHSMAGAELTGVGMLHSDRIGGLVYLDAIGDATDDPPDDPAWKAAQAKLPPPGPQPACTNDRSSFAAFRAFLQCRHGIALPEAELRAGFEPNADGSVGAARSPGWVSRAIGTGRPARDYSRITVPVLAISDAVDFDLTHLKPEQPQPRNDDDRAAIVAFGKATQAVFDRWSANLKRGVPGAKVINLPGATHYLWMTREADVLREIHTFIAGLLRGGEKIEGEQQKLYEGRDPSPHQVRFVTVAPDVKLEVLDWGGTGRALVLLAGSGHSAHVYDDFAAKLAGFARVYGITRRGFGTSSQPESGYDDQRLADDVFAVIDALGLDRPLLIGHSMAGGELTTLGRQHSDRLGGLVYLDALGDPRDWPGSDGAWRALEQKLPSSGARRCEPDHTTFAALRISLQCDGAFAFPESELRQTFATNADGTVGSYKTPRRIFNAIGDGQIRRDYAGVRVPVLAFRDRPRTSLAERWPDDPPMRTEEERADVLAFMLATKVFMDRWLTNLTTHVTSVRVVELDGAGHYVFLTREARVVDEIRAFVSTPPAR